MPQETPPGSPFDYIEIFCNRSRMHSALDSQSPDQYEKQFNRLAYVP
ncbi:MAG: IS3 family transposase [Luteimonas sp.]